MSVTDDIIYKVIDIMVNVGQSDYRKFRVGETIRYSPSELLGILKQHKSELDPLLPIVPVRHAKWISCSSSEHYKCSCCGTRASFWFDEENSSGWQMDMSEWLSDYCPHCGSRMLE